jgi:hypothetical protein
MSPIPSNPKLWLPIRTTVCRVITTGTTTTSGHPMTRQVVSITWALPFVHTPGAGRTVYPCPLSVRARAAPLPPVYAPRHARTPETHRPKLLPNPRCCHSLARNTNSNKHNDDITTPPLLGTQAIFATVTPGQTTPASVRVRLPPILRVISVAAAVIHSWLGCEPTVLALNKLAVWHRNTVADGRCSSSIRDVIMYTGIMNSVSESSSMRRRINIMHSPTPLFLQPKAIAAVSCLL